MEETEIHGQSLIERVYQAACDGQANSLFDMLWNQDRQTVVKPVLNHRSENEGQSMTPLLAAAKAGNENVIHVLLNVFCVEIEQTGTVIIDKQVVEGATALWCAACDGHFDVVKLLVRYGADVNHPTFTNSTPIRPACFDGRLDIVKYLVDYKADITISNKHNNNCLMVASYNGHYSVVEYLVERGIDLDKQDDTGSTALHGAAQKGHFVIVKFLIDCGAEVKTNNNKMTPLHLAAVNGHAEIVEYLSSLPGCNKEDRIDALELLAASFTDGQPYDLAASFAYLQKAMQERYCDLGGVMEKVLKAPVPAYGNRIECTTLSQLEKLENEELELHMEALCIRERVLGPENPEVPDPVIYSGAVFADNGKYGECVALWLHALKLSQEIDMAFFMGRFSEVFAEMFHLDIKIEFSSILEVLELGITELELSLERIAKAEADTKSLKNEHEENILACIYLVDIMLRMVNRDDEEHNLHRAVYKFNKLNLCLTNGFTPLHIVCGNSDTFEHTKFDVKDVIVFPDAMLCRTLLICGARVNAHDNQRNTPLHIIAKCAESINDSETLSKMIECLIINGAHLDVCNTLGQTALDVATTDEAQNAIKAQMKLRLKCLAARVVKRLKLIYQDIIPLSLQEFIEIH